MNEREESRTIDRLAPVESFVSSKLKQEFLGSILDFILLADAEDDFVEADNWYESKEFRVGYRFLNHFQEGLGIYLQSTPREGRISATRQSHLKTRLSRDPEAQSSSPQTSRTSAGATPRLHPRITARFCLLPSLLNACSAFKASGLLPKIHQCAILSGPRPRVYRAPVPSRCCRIRRFKSFVIPQYKLPSPHRSTYTHHAAPAFFAHIRSSDTATGESVNPAQ